MPPKKDGQPSETPAKSKEKKVVLNPKPSNNRAGSEGDVISCRRAKLSPEELQIVDLEYDSKDDLLPFSKWTYPILSALDSTQRRHWRNRLRKAVLTNPRWQADSSRQRPPPPPFNFFFHEHDRFKDPVTRKIHEREWWTAESLEHWMKISNPKAYQDFLTSHLERIADEFQRNEIMPERIPAWLTINFFEPAVRANWESCSSSSGAVSLLRGLEEFQDMQKANFNGLLIHEHVAHLIRQLRNQTPTRSPAPELVEPAVIPANAGKKRAVTGSPDPAQRPVAPFMPPILHPYAEDSVPNKGPFQRYDPTLLADVDPEFARGGVRPSIEGPSQQDAHLARGSQDVEWEEEYNRRQIAFEEDCGPDDAPLPPGTKRHVSSAESEGFSSGFTTSTSSKGGKGEGSSRGGELPRRKGGKQPPAKKIRDEGKHASGKR